MKRLTTLTTAFLIAVMLAVAPAQAQQPQQQNRRQGMMQDGQGMMQMMQSPLHRQSMMAFILPALADTLGLSEEQRSQLQQHKSDMLRQRQQAAQSKKTHREQLMDLFEDDGQPAPDEVRQHLAAMAEIQTDQKVALYETAQQMRQTLTDAQRQMLSGLTMQQKMRQMMMNMTMMDMMQMMQAMHGGMRQGRQDMMPMMMQHMQHMQQMQQQGGMQQQRQERRNRQP